MPFKTMVESSVAFNIIINFFFPELQFHKHSVTQKDVLLRCNTRPIISPQDDSCPTSQYLDRDIHHTNIILINWCMLPFNVIHVVIQSSLSVWGLESSFVCDSPILCSMQAWVHCKCHKALCVSITVGQACARDRTGTGSNVYCGK